jgi:hypothetical protein
LLAAYLSARGLVENGVSWEEYQTDPASAGPEQRITLIFVQLRD